MEKKRSKGVTFWGWGLIICGILGLLGAINSRRYGIGIISVGTVISAMYLICGIFVLKLNETARKVVILLGIISMLLIPVNYSFFIRPTLNMVKSEDAYAKQKQVIIDQMKPEYQQKALKDLEKTNEIMKKSLPIFLLVVFILPSLLFNLITICFFTRPKVKEQFQ
ncbi:MAG: hypothetical protein NT066_00910 [Candidatus Omnitrophica bacterium]|nr:hypothetical protein [Candidatus Omnitrophota bacterium]